MNNAVSNNGRSSHGSCSGVQDASSITVEPPTPEEVIEKIKDDGDFDRLRRKIINKLRSNEALRSNIYSAVKRSKALTGTSRNLKPRQLLDIIHQEMGTELMSQVSDAVWELIRSKEDMGREISETVETVYQKMVSERRKAQETEGAPSSRSPASTDQQPDGSPPVFEACNQQPSGNEANGSSSVMAMHGQQLIGKQSDTGPPACDDSSRGVLEPHKAFMLSLTESDQHYTREAPENTNQPCSSDVVRVSRDTNPSELAIVQQNVRSQQVADNDMDPDVPPGFG